MSIPRIISAVAMGFAVVTYSGSSSLAQERLPDGSVVEFVVPNGSPPTAPSSTVVFTGPADGTVVGPGSCGAGGQLQSTVVIAPAQRTVSMNVIVVKVDEVTNPPAVPPGTRLGSFVGLGLCGPLGL